VDAAGHVNVVWLDHRALASDGGRAAMSHHDTGHDAAAGVIRRCRHGAAVSLIRHVAPPDLKVDRRARSASTGHAARDHRRRLLLLQDRARDLG
jgi:hypothetical protein